jgi:hypothetical protein
MFRTVFEALAMAFLTAASMLSGDEPVSEMCLYTWFDMARPTGSEGLAASKMRTATS